MVVEINIYVNKSKLFLELLQNNGIDVTAANLFGSAVKGIPDNESDIDIAVFSKDFQGLPYEDIKIQ
jgi:hypothetical protein